MVCQRSHHWGGPILHGILHFQTPTLYQTGGCVCHVSQGDLVIPGRIGRSSPSKKKATANPKCQDLASGKRLHNYGKSPFFMGKLTIDGHFQ